jgi:leucyl-tRNA synthetase
MNSNKRASDEAKFYVAPMFPYPSGRLHMGHARNYAIADAYARHARARGRETLFPIGWDSFGLPAEKAAIQSGADPKAWTESNIETMRGQLKAMNFSFDWDSELATHEPSYYRHTQAIFIQLMRSGWVERRDGEVWWDPVDQTALANEQVVDGKGWRSGAPVEKRRMPMHWIKASAQAQALASAPLAWSQGAKADHLAWVGFDAATGQARLRDWCVSRGRKWGTPLPAVDCEACGSVPMNPSALPFVHADMGKPCACPGCGGAATNSRETLDTFFDSAWYFLRYPEIGQEGAEAAPFGEASKRWAPVDLYVGGREHATMHLVYARVVSQALSQAGWGCPAEPFARYMAQGMVKARAFEARRTDGSWEWVEPARVKQDPKSGQWFDESGREAFDRGVQKMSKTKLNGVDPTEVAARLGVDPMRLFLFFAAPFEFDVEWDESAVAGCSRFAKKIEALAVALAGQKPARPQEPSPQSETESARFGAFVDAQYQRFEGLNALVAAIMKKTGSIAKSTAPWSERAREFLDVCKALSPMAPSLAQSCAARVDPEWTPRWDAWGEQEAKSPMRRVAIQREGKYVAAVEMPAGLSAREAFERAIQSCEGLGFWAQESCASWQEAVWIPDRALNVKAPLVAHKPGRP